MDRTHRIEIFRENLEYFEQGGYLTPSGREVRFAPTQQQWYDAPFELEPAEPVAGGTLFEVRNADCIDVTGELKEKGYDVAVLNMASASHPGGGVETGAGAQEEQLCRRSNLPLSLWRYKREKARQYPGLGISTGREQYPLHPRFGGIWSDSILFFRENEASEYALSEKPFRAAVISVAAIAHPRLDASGMMNKEDAARTKDKMRTILRIGMEHCHDALVLGALGCGAFANPPAQVSRLFKEVFGEGEFKGQFKKVVFAILEDRNSRMNASGGNLAPFRRVFE